MQASTHAPAADLLAGHCCLWNRYAFGVRGSLKNSFGRRCALLSAKRLSFGLSSNQIVRNEITTPGKIGSSFRSSTKPLHSRLSDGDLSELVTRKIYPSSDAAIEDAASVRYRTKSSGTVWPYVMFAALGALLFGYNLGVVNGALEYLSRDLSISENTVLQGSIVSTLLIGGIIGALAGGTMADRFGRARALKLNAIPLAIGAFLCATTRTVGTLVIGRFISGIGAGVASSVVPLYISEISPTETRGMLGSVYQFAVSLGILMALLIGLPLAGNPVWWRTMFLVAVVPAIIMAFGLNISPESPRWLFQHGRISDAEAASRTLFGKEKTSEVMLDLRAAGDPGTSKQPEGNWSDLFSKPYRSAATLGVLLFLFQQLGGINAVIYYSTAMFRRAGIVSDIAASVLVGLGGILGTLVSAALVDKQGRKSLLLSSFLGMAASMLLLSLSFSSNASPYSGILAVLGTILYVISYGLGAGPVPPFLIPEVFPSRIRAKGLALSQATSWLASFTVGLYFLSMANKYGISRVYLGFAAVSLLAALYIGRNLFETKGRSLELIDRSVSPVI